MNEPITGEVKKNVIDTPDYPWFHSGYNSYEPNQEVIKAIQEKKEGVSVIVFMGTWCGDTQRELPRFYKIMEQVDMPMEVIALDRSKQSPEKTEEKYSIKSIPTFIFIKGERELGRIIESPDKTLEGDMLRILERS